MEEKLTGYDEIVNALYATGKFGKRAAWIGARAGFRCEYCDLDFLTSVETYKEWQEDHIVPTSADGADNVSNIALACRTCNVNLKSRWDPRTVCGPNANREELIRAVRKYVEEKRVRSMEEVLIVRKVVSKHGRS